MINNVQKRGIKDLSVFIECSTGSTPTVKNLKEYIDVLQQFGYNIVYLGLTNAYKIEGEPYFNYLRGGYTTEQLQEIDCYARERGIELRANVQVLGHMCQMHRHGCYNHLFDTWDVLMVGQEEVYQFIDKIFATMSAGVQSRTIHIGMDEAIDLGTGRYYKEHGYRSKRELLLEHLNRVVAIAKKYNYTCEIWSDMFFRLLRESSFDDNGVIPSDLKGCIPEGVRIIHWKYQKQPDEVFRGHISQAKAICDSVGFATSAWKQQGMAPHNKFSIELAERQMAICQELNVGHFMVTLWSDNGAYCSINAVLPALFAIAEMNFGKSKEDIDKERFREITGVAFDDFMLLDNMNNPFFKNLKTINSRCSWGFLADIFLGHLDWYLDENSNEAYAELVERYAAVEAGKYQLLFREFELYAKVLSIKMNIGLCVRNAYHVGNKALLEHYAKVEIPRMTEYMNEFVEIFNKRWLSENMAYGLEVPHLYYGGQVERWKYVQKRILQYLEDEQPIEEMEREELVPSILPICTEDSLYGVKAQYALSFC